MRVSWLTTDAGFTSSPMGMFGFLMSITIPGGLTATGAGCGIRCVVGPGSPTILGAGVSTTMEDGSGALVWAGTGSQPAAGARPGFPGIMGLTIMAGVR